MLGSHATGVVEPVDVEDETVVGIDDRSHQRVGARELVAHPAVPAVPLPSLGRRPLELQLHVHGQDHLAPAPHQRPRIATGPRSASASPSSISGSDTVAAAPSSRIPRGPGSGSLVTDATS